MLREEEKGKKILFSTTYAKYLAQGVDVSLKTAWKAVKVVHAVEFENKGVYEGERRKVSGNSGRRATTTMCVPFTQKLHLAVI